MADIGQPLQQQQNIVDPKTGKPSDYFMRYLRDRGGLLVDKADKSIEIIAGTGLSGGGDLSADRTLNLEDTTVTPGVYGDATNTPQITVDQQGRVTNIVDVPIAGGGGSDKIAAAQFEVNLTTFAITINSSFNIASITRNGAGRYDVAFTTPAANAFYGVSGGGQYDLFAGNNAIPYIGINRNSPSNSQYDVNGFSLGASTDGGAFVDVQHIFFRVWDPAA